MHEVDENKANLGLTEDREPFVKYTPADGFTITAGSGGKCDRSSGIAGGAACWLGDINDLRVTSVNDPSLDCFGSGTGHFSPKIGGGRYCVLPGSNSYTTAEGSSMLTKTINGINRLTSDPFSIAVSGLTQDEVDRLATLVERAISG